MEYTTMERDWIWLASAEGMTARRFYRALEMLKDPGQMRERLRDPAMEFLGEKCLAALRSSARPEDAQALVESLDRRGQRALTRVSDQWPSVLDEIVDPPHILYLMGEGSPQGARQVGVVGSRRASRDGLRASRELSEGLAREAVCVISGLARGIDSQAHTGALDGGGRTLAVLGCGLDVVYPPENAPLRQRILSNGGLLVSEYPPGTPPLARNFPRRNRLISAFSQAVLVVEGARSSGAMITASVALDQGREVFAVPGSIYSVLSVGPNNLIRDGAFVALSHWDILEAMHWGSRPAKRPRQAQRPEMTREESAVADALGAGELSFDELIEATGMEAPALNSLLTILELRGIIRKAPGQMYRTNL